jgi:hypothetical protein
MRATLRQIDVTVERIRRAQKAARCQPAYREALEHLQTVIEIALDPRDRPRLSPEGHRELTDLNAMWAAPAAKARR